MEEWHATANASGKSLKIFAYGAWYDESVEYLKEQWRIHRPPLPHRLRFHRGCCTQRRLHHRPRPLVHHGRHGQIPVVLIIDEEGYIIAQQATGTPIDGWAKFDGILETALTEEISETFDSRIGWEEPETSYTAVFALGLVLSILVYFSPCAFPVLPGFISYYLSLALVRTS